MNITEVATAVVQHRDTGKFLLAKRTTDTDIHPGKWNFPGGKIEEQDENPAEAARRELKEETGLEEEPVRTGESFTLDTVDGVFKIFPVHFHTSSDPELNTEHTDYQWIGTEELDSFETVNGLRRDLEKVGLI